MKINVSQIEQNAAVLLSNTTTYILQQIAALQDELENQGKANQKLIKQNDILREIIKNQEESIRTDPSLSNK